MKTGVKVSDAMTKKPIVVKPDISVKKCAKLMAKKDVGSLVVKEDNRLLGIVTVEDFTYGVVAKDKDVNKTKVKDVMIRRVVTIDPNKDIYDALVLMKKKNIKQLPVAVKNELVGLLTMKDILKIEPALFDILVEKYKLREESKKPVFGKRYMEGECASCGNFAQLYNVNDQWLCEECKDRK